MDKEPEAKGARLRLVTPEDVEQWAADGTLYGPISRHAAEAALKAAFEEEPEPPTAA
jgi:hypothetical protein